ncbi:MAG: rhomboid family intramembrane serine protease [Tannerella sp.]|jgi:membrane associated rhomboid family serine protease|nr:rhomboid family intramembrane serine protease [Tannerella sp.]
MDREAKEAIHAAIAAAMPVAAIWVTFALDNAFGHHAHLLGLVPRDAGRLYGILFFPVLHADLDHLIANTPPLFLLVFGLILFYGDRGWNILGTNFLISGFITWCMGRPDTLHIGASSLVYALAAFHFASGLIRRVPRQMAFSLLVAFLYGGFVWAFFPTLYIHTSISWEGHLSGLLTGLALAFHYRRLGPPMPADPFADEDSDDENDDGEDAYWKTGE